MAVLALQPSCGTFTEHASIYPLQAMTGETPFRQEKITMIENSFKLSADYTQVLDAADRYAREQLHPLWQKMDEKDWYPEHIMPQLGADGWLGITAPEEMGGAGMDLISQCLVCQAFHRWNHSIGAIAGAHDNLCMNNILRNASQTAVQKYIPDMVTGKKIGALGMTEPGAGSDAIGSMATTARREGDNYIINGRKMFCSNGPFADVILLYAKTEKNRGAGGVSAFIVDTTSPGFSVAQKLPKMGWRGQHTGELVFDDCEVPAENLVGEENKGIAVMMSGLDIERIYCSFECLGMAERAFDLALEYAKDRVQFGQPIGNFQMVQDMLATMYTTVESMRLMCYRAGAELNHLEKGGGGRGAKHKLSAATYLHCGEGVIQVTDLAVQIWGGYGLITESEVNYLYRSARLMTIGGGTSQVRKMIIGQELMKQ